MARIDDPTIYDPYGWRLAETADPATPVDRRDQLRDELVAWEAEELAHGYRHLTIVHGDPETLEASRLVSTFYDRLRAFAARVPRVRVRGTVDYVTVTVRGAEADDEVTVLTAIAMELNPGDWTITQTACPPDQLVR